MTKTRYILLAMEKPCLIPLGGQAGQTLRWWSRRAGFENSGLGPLKPGFLWRGCLRILTHHSNHGNYSSRTLGLTGKTLSLWQTDPRVVFGSFDGAWWWRSLHGVLPCLKAMISTVEPDGVSRRNHEGYHGSGWTWGTFECLIPRRIWGCKKEVESSWRWQCH